VIPSSVALWPTLKGGRGMVRTCSFSGRPLNESTGLKCRRNSANVDELAVVLPRIPMCKRCTSISAAACTRAFNSPREARHSSKPTHKRHPTNQLPYTTMPGAIILVARDQCACMCARHARLRLSYSCSSVRPRWLLDVVLR
jgi:hypothetical protein